MAAPNVPSIPLLSIFDVILRPGGTPVWTVLNSMFSSLNSQNLNFISTGIFGLLAIYLLWSVQKGNIKFGLRIPFIVSFHPMKKN
jgi:LMBR1 domain-containing protein 1